MAGNNAKGEDNRPPADPGDTPEVEASVDTPVEETVDQAADAVTTSSSTSESSAVSVEDGATGPADESVKSADPETVADTVTDEAAAPLEPTPVADATEAKESSPAEPDTTPAPTEDVADEPGHPDDLDHPDELDHPDDLDNVDDPEATAAAEAVDDEPAPTRRPVKRSPAELDDEATAAPVVRTAEKKNRPTRTRSEATAADAPKKTGPGTFVGQVVQELKKVVWPSGNQLWQYFIIVLLFVLFMIAFVGLLDLLFGWLTLKWFG